MSETFQVFAFIFGMFSLLGLAAFFWSWDNYIDRRPCPKCGKRLVLKTTRYAGPYMGKAVGALDSSYSTMVDTYRCLKRGCKHVRTERWYTKPYPYCPTPYDWYKPPGHPYHRDRF